MGGAIFGKLIKFLGESIILFFPEVGSDVKPPFRRTLQKNCRGTGGSPCLCGNANGPKCAVPTLWGMGPESRPLWDSGSSKLETWVCGITGAPSPGSPSQGPVGPFIKKGGRMSPRQPPSPFLNSGSNQHTPPPSFSWCQGREESLPQPDQSCPKHPPDEVTLFFAGSWLFLIFPACDDKAFKCQF